MEGEQMHSEAAGAAPAATEGKGSLKPCAACQKPFAARRKWARFCSTNCRNEWHRSMTPEAMRRDIDELLRKVQALEAIINP